MPPATDCGQPLLKNTTITIMVDNTNVLVWQQRLQKTEDLIHKRRQDLQGHEQRCLSLQDELTQQQEISVSVLFVLLFFAGGCCGWRGAAAVAVVAHNSIHHDPVLPRLLLLLLWQDQAVQDLAGLREQCEAATRHRVDLQRDITNTRQDAAAAKDTARQVCTPAASTPLLSHAGGLLDRHAVGVCPFWSTPTATPSLHTQ